MIKAMFLNDQLHYGLGYSTTSNLTTKLFPGAIYNSYQMNVYIQVIDEEGAFSTFKIEQPVTVIPDVTNLKSMIQKIINEDPYFISNIILNEGSYLGSIQELQSICALLNEQSLSDKLGLILKKIAPVFPHRSGPLSNYSGVVAVNSLITEMIFTKMTGIKIETIPFVISFSLVQTVQ